MKNILTICISIVFFVACCTQKDNSASIVYITATGTKYHNSACRYLSKSSIPVSLADATTRRYGPCSDCAPALLKMKDTVETKYTPERPKEKQMVKPGTTQIDQPRCSAFTKKGGRCKRKVKTEGDTCFQHHTN